MRMFGQTDVSVFDTLDHDKHRMGHAPWNPYFSKQPNNRIQPLLTQTAIDKLCDRLHEHQMHGKPVIMTHAYACLTTDIISQYSFPDGYDLLSKPEFDGADYDAWMALSRISHSLKQFGWLYPLLDSMPQWVTKATSPDFYVVLKQQNYLYDQAKIIAKRREKADYNELTKFPSMLQAFMDSEQLPESQKSPERIKAEAQIAIGAGTLTATHALKVATYHILANKHVHSKLMAELSDHFPDKDQPPNLRHLEQMPYLMATMYETLRILYGVSHRLSRVFPNRVLQYNEWTIPPGSLVSMSTPLIHDNEDIFPDHCVFKPER